MGLFSTDPFWREYQIQKLERVGVEVSPVLIFGFAAACFLSRWSPLSPQCRSRVALVCSGLLAFYIIFAMLGFVFFEGSHPFGELQSSTFYGTVSAFGLAFAMSFLRYRGQPGGCLGCLCVAFHVLVVLFTFSPPQVVE